MLPGFLLPRSAVRNWVRPRQVEVGSAVRCVRRSSAGGNVPASAPFRLMKPYRIPAADPGALRSVPAIVRFFEGVALKKAAAIWSLAWISCRDAMARFRRKGAEAGTGGIPPGCGSGIRHGAEAPAFIKPRGAASPPGSRGTESGWGGDQKQGKNSGKMQKILLTKG